MSNVKGQRSNVALIPTNKVMIKKHSKPIAHCSKLFQLEYSNTRTLEHKKTYETLNFESCRV